MKTCWFASLVGCPLLLAACAGTSSESETASLELSQNAVTRIEVRSGWLNGQPPGLVSWTPTDFPLSSHCWESHYVFDLNAKTVQGMGCDRNARPAEFRVDRALTRDEVTALRTELARITAAPAAPCTIDVNQPVAGVDIAVARGTATETLRDEGAACLTPSAHVRIAPESANGFLRLADRVATTTNDRSVVTFETHGREDEIDQLRLWRNPNGTYDVVHRWVRYERTCGHDGCESRRDVDWHGWSEMSCVFPSDAKIECTFDRRDRLPPPVNLEAISAAALDRHQTRFVSDVDAGVFNRDILTFTRLATGNWRIDCARDRFRISSTPPSGMWGTGDWVHEDFNVLVNMPRY